VQERLPDLRVERWTEGSRAGADVLPLRVVLGTATAPPSESPGPA
jgi:hypothetical protein